jgi:uncharacterized Zn finger protein
MTKPFGTTWWGREWMAALERRAGLDPARLARGKAYARGNAVRSLDVTPGSVTAVVRGSRVVPYDVTVALRTFGDEEWERLYDVVSARIAHAAALLDGELPADLVADVAAAGLSLLPEPGELTLTCSCPDEAVPCKHAAAVCYLVADLLDGDPFELLLLRGRTRAEVLGALRARRSGESTDVVVAHEADDEDAAAAFARVPAPLPDLPLPPHRPGKPSPLVGAPPEGTVSPADLQALAADAAQRAWELVTGAGDGGLTLSAEEDLARRAASLLGTTALDRLAKKAGLPPRQLSRRAAAWLRGGRYALAIMEQTWAPDEADVYEGVAALGGNAHVYRNQVSDASDSKQLRLGQDGLWYPLHRRSGTWELAGPPNADPRAALAGIG